MPVEFLGQTNGRFAFRIIPIHRPSHDRATSRAEAGKAFAFHVTVPDQRRLRRRQFLDARVVRRMILRRSRLEGGHYLVVFKIINRVRLIRANEQWPSEVTCLGRGIDFIIPERVNLQLRKHIRSHIAEVQRAVGVIDCHAKRIAHTHRVHFRSTLFWVGKQIPLRNRVPALILRLDAQNLAAQILRVACRTHGVPTLFARPIIDRQPRLPVAVVAIANVQVAAAVHEHRAAHVKNVFIIIRPLE